MQFLCVHQCREFHTDACNVPAARAQGPSNQASFNMSASLDLLHNVFDIPSNSEDAHYEKGAGEDGDAD